MAVYAGSETTEHWRKCFEIIFSIELSDTVAAVRLHHELPGKLVRQIEVKPDEAFQ